MPCPVCGSHDLWDDNLAWGCEKCPFFTTGGIQNTGSSRDRFREDVMPVLPAPLRPFPACCQFCGRELNRPYDPMTKGVNGSCLTCLIG